MLIKRLTTFFPHVQIILIRSGLISKIFVVLLFLIVFLTALVMKDLSSKSEIPSAQDNNPESNFIIDQVVTPTQLQKSNPITVIPSVTTAQPTTNAINSPTSTPTPVSNSSQQPTATPTPGVADTESPHTNIYFPQEGGTITFSYQPSSGNYPCIALNPPSDNVSSTSDIMTEYAVDGGSWSGYASADSRAFICMAIPNGSHSIQIRSKDKAGNVESPQTLNFIVNIPN